MPVEVHDSLHAFAMHADDVAEVIAVEQNNYAFPWTEGIFRDCLKAGYTCQILRVGEELVGYAILQVGPGEAHILNLCVERRYNGRGYARVLLQRLFEHAQRQGAEIVFLEVRRSNERAIRLYSLSGFNEISVRRGYYDSADGREDAILMARTL